MPLIKSLIHGGHIVTNTGISFFRQGTNYRVIVSASRARGGDIYLDKQILALVEKNNFEKVSDKMAAVVDESRITQLVEILQTNHGCAVTINSAQFRDIGKSSHSYSSRKQINIPPKQEEGHSHIISLLELEAEALALELELLAA